jgi:hypothetical protein
LFSPETALTVKEVKPTQLRRRTKVFQTFQKADGQNGEWLRRKKLSNQQIGKKQSNVPAECWGLG